MIWNELWMILKVVCVCVRVCGGGGGGPCIVNNDCFHSKSLYSEFPILFNCIQFVTVNFAVNFHSIITVFSAVSFIYDVYSVRL